MVATRWPAFPSATPTGIAVVDLPDPPFSLPSTTTWADRDRSGSACSALTSMASSEAHKCVAVLSWSRLSLTCAAFIMNRGARAPALIIFRAPNSTDIEVNDGMGRNIHVARSIVALDRALRRIRRAGKVALVPTMGALHKGHFALVRQARRRAARVIVSIFVNPAQFAPTEDFGSYPRTFAHDLAELGKLDVDLVWAPDADVMYPQGFATRIVPEGPALAGLEDRFRPHFFGGVATVVAKLFTKAGPT